MPTTPPRLRDIEALLAAAEDGSLGAAARRLGLSQPALSQAITRLEAAVGQPLLLRGPRGSFASEAGARFLARCRRMMGQLQAGLAACRSAARVGLLTDTAAETHRAIVRAGSFSAAARLRGVSLPTLARTARGLEGALGVPLYRRAAGGMVPLPGGVELGRRLALAAEELDQGLAELAASGRVEWFRLGTLPMLPQDELARAIAGLGVGPDAGLGVGPDAGLGVGADAGLGVGPDAGLGVGPDAALGAGPRVTLRDGTHAALLDQLRHGAIDAILGALRNPAPADDVVEEMLSPDPFVIAAAAGHPLAHGGPVAAAALAAQDWVVPEPGLPRRATAEALFATLPRHPRLAMETNSPHATIALLRRTRALALLSRRQVAAAPGLVALPVPPLGPPRAIGLTTRRDWLPTPGQRAVLEALRQAFAAVSPGAEGSA
ncbi:LysR family transcriptional regulator [Falsiroseomonas ponticola]|uniref:LysR family transcriptional regulator n=1 Tax=Falsiroseomonas ponticola TaxID=2786951 RepID=UPI0019326677|nr:LysR family transcriptional regulator [Roseomonas ponticola]